MIDIRKIFKQTRNNKKWKRSLAWKAWRRQRNKLRHGANRIKIEFLNTTKGYSIIKVPLTFSFINNPEDVIEFMNKLKIYLKRRDKVFVNLKNVKQIDYGAITALLSVMFEFKSYRVGFNGSFPKDASVKKLLVDSGFFDYLYYPLGKKIQYTIGKPNQMFTQANKVVESTLGLPIMLEVSKTIWGEKRIFKGLQRLLVELMQNTNNHAYLNEKGRERWWLSVNHDIEKKTVSFVFVDYGIGVFESLKNKKPDNKWYGLYEKILSKMNKRSNDEVLRLLLAGELHLTVTGDHFRGKGLPGILQITERNQISNLYIITNEVYGDVSNNKYKLLENSFSGTFFCWEINNLNESLEWTISA